MRSGKISHKKAWDQVAQMMNSKEYVVTGRQCNTRVNTMKRTYKAIKDHNRKSDNDKRSWKYFELMESLLGDEPNITPLATISSTGAETLSLKIRASTSSMSNLSSGSICDNEENKENINVPRKPAYKRKLNDDIQAILESHKISEEKKDKRHKEKIEIQEKLMMKSNKMLEKL